MSGVVVLIRYTALPGREEEGLRALAELVPVVLEREKECSRIVLLRDTADPAKIALIEDWPTEESFLGPHMETPHLREFRERAPELYAGPPEISFARVVPTR